MLDVISMGEALIDFLADRPGISLTQSKVFTWAPGGAPANVAVAAAKLGLAAGFLGKVGNDPFGLYLRDTLRSCGVDTTSVLLSDQARTALAFVALPTPETPQFTFYRNPSADMLLREEELDAAYLKDTKCLHFGSITLITDPSRTATLAAVRVAKEGGAFISFDANYRPALWSAKSARIRITEALPLCDVVKVNDTEATLITGKRDPIEAAHDILGFGPKVCLVTLGERGSVYVTPRTSGQVPGFPVKAVDATGCGDGFVAAALKGIIAAGDVSTLGPGDLERILYYANAVGALTATKKGGIPALPTEGQVNAFLAQI